MLAHWPPVSRPLRSISTVSPAAEAPTFPLNVAGRCSSAEARVLNVIPLPLALTVTSAR